MSTKCQSVWTEKQKCLQDVFAERLDRNCYYSEYDNEYRDWRVVCDYLAPVDICTNRVSTTDPTADVLTESDMEALLKAQPQNYSLIQAWPAFPGKPDALRQLFDHPRKINHDAFGMYREMARKPEEIEVVDSFYRMLKLQKRPSPRDIVYSGLLLTTTCDDTAKRFADQSCWDVISCMAGNEIFTAADVERLIKEDYASDDLSNALQRLGGDPELLVDNNFNHGDNLELYDQMGGKNIKALEDLLKIEYWASGQGSGEGDDNGALIDRIANTVPVILAKRYQTPEKVATIFPYFQEYKFFATPEVLKTEVLNKVFTRYKELNGDPKVLRDFILDPKTGASVASDQLTLNAVNVYSQMERVADNNIKETLRSLVLGNPDDEIKGLVFSYIIEGKESFDYDMWRTGLSYKDVIDIYKRLGGSASDLVNDLDLKVSGDIEQCELDEDHCGHHLRLDSVLISYMALGGNASGLEKYLTLDTGSDELDTEYRTHAALAMLGIYMNDAAKALGDLAEEKPELFN